MSSIASKILFICSVGLFPIGCSVSNDPGQSELSLKDAKIKWSLNTDPNSLPASMKWVLNLTGNRVPLIVPQPGSGVGPNNVAKAGHWYLKLILLDQDTRGTGYDDNRYKRFAGAAPDSFSLRPGYTPSKNIFLKKNGTSQKNAMEIARSNASVKQFCDGLDKINPEGSKVVSISISLAQQTSPSLDFPPREQMDRIRNTATTAPTNPSSHPLKGHTLNWFANGSSFNSLDTALLLGEIYQRERNELHNIKRSVVDEKRMAKPGTPEGDRLLEPGEIVKLPTKKVDSKHIAWRKEVIFNYLSTAPGRMVDVGHLPGYPDGKPGKVTPATEAASCFFAQKGGDGFYNSEELTVDQAISLLEEFGVTLVAEGQNYDNTTAQNIAQPNQRNVEQSEAQKNLSNQQENQTLPQEQNNIVNFNPTVSNESPQDSQENNESNGISIRQPIRL